MTLDTKALEAALLPCPFCGSPAREEAPETRTGMWEIGCPANWSPTRMRDICNAAPAVAETTREATVAAWNRRASPPSILEEAARTVETWDGWEAVTSRRLIARAIMAERERCAAEADKVVAENNTGSGFDSHSMYSAAFRIAAAIRKSEA